MEQVINGFKRIIEFSSAFDKRNPDPQKNYGVHSVEMRFLLKGEKGTVQFLLFTGWDLPSVQKERWDKDRSIWNGHILPADLGYHSYKPMYENQTCISKKCPYLDNKPCYYDGSGLNAEKPYEILTSKGEEALWKFLEKYYKETF